MDVNNSEQKVIIKCQKMNCGQDLLVPKDSYRIFCPNCNFIFVSPNYEGIYHKIDVLHYFT